MTYQPSADKPWFKSWPEGVPQHLDYPEIPPYKYIREVEFIKEIPKTPVGKVLRRVLRDREQARQGLGLGPAQAEGQDKP